MVYFLYKSGKIVIFNDAIVGDVEIYHGFSAFSPQDIEHFKAEIEKRQLKELTPDIMTNSSLIENRELTIDNKDANDNSSS